MIDFNQIQEARQGRPMPRIAVAAASSQEVKIALEALTRDLAHFVLIGDAADIRASMRERGLADDAVEVIDLPDHAAAARLALSLCRDGTADLPMKGLLHTATFMRAVLDPDSGFSAPGNRISEITAFEGIGGKMTLMTDCAINIDPDRALKKKIIENAVDVAHRLGNPNPKVALLGALEIVNEAMPDTIDSAVLTQMNRRGQIKGCVVDGPLSLDNAISESAARRKGIDGPVAGDADILVVPNLLVGNALGKSLSYYANAVSATVIAGVASPVVMTSRTENVENKLRTLTLACYLAGK